MFQSSSHKLSILNGRNELFRNVKFFDITMITIRDDDVDGVGFGDDELGVQRILGNIEGDRATLVNSKVGNHTLGLNFNAIGVDNLNTRDDIVEDDGSLATVVDGDGIDFGVGDLDDTVVELVAVENVLGLGVLADDDGLVALVPFDDPLVALQFGDGGLGGGSGSTAARSGGLGGAGGGRDDAGGTELGVFVGLHVFGDLLETRGDAITLVEGGKQVVAGSSGSGTRLAGFGNRGRRRAGRRRGRSTTSRGSRGRLGTTGGHGRFGITTVGVPVETLGVVLVDVGLELSEEALEGVDPLDLVLVGGRRASLELGQERVEVEDGTIKTFLDNRGRKTVHLGISLGPEEPLEPSNGFGQSRHVVKVIITLARNALGSIHLGGGLEEGRDDGNLTDVGGLLALGGHLHDGAEARNGSDKVTNLGFETIRSDHVGSILKRLEMILNQLIKSNQHSMIGSSRRRR